VVAPKIITWHVFPPIPEPVIRLVCPLRRARREWSIRLREDRGRAIKSLTEDFDAPKAGHD